MAPVPAEPYVRCVNPRLPPRPHQATPAVPDVSDVSDVPTARLGFDDDSSGSLGTSWQLLAVGAQNYVLDLNPQMTFFRRVYRRHTAFAVECFSDAFDLRLGGTTTVELPRRGDALGDMLLEIDLPNLNVPGGTWADAIGYVLLTRVRFVIDDVVVHDQERLWYDMTDRLLMPHGRLAAVDAMIGRGRVLATDRAHTVTVPLKFAWCTGHYRRRAFLPIGALATRTKVVVELGAEALAGCVVLPAGAAAAVAPASLRARLLSDQAFLDRDEQRALRQRASTLLIETAQDMDALTYRFDDAGTYGVASAQVDLRELNLPVKLLAFVAYDENDAVNARYFRYRDCVDRAVLLFSSGERFRPRSGAYFSLVQPYQHCTRCAADLVHAYSFALDAADRQPSGAFNFAVADGPVLRVDLKNVDDAPVKLKCFAYCYNWLTVDGGAAALAFTA